MDENFLEGYPVVVDLPVVWGDMDAFQHVYNVAYFRYFESARIVYSDKLGLQQYKEEAGIGPILGSTSCRYRLPLTYPDTVSVGTKITGMEEDRFTMQYVVSSLRHRKVAADGDAVIVMCDYRAGRKTVIPEEVRKRILAMEKGL